MIRKTILCLALLAGPGLWAQSQAPPPTAAQKELQSPLNLGDEKPTPGVAPATEPSGWRAFGSLFVVLALVGGGLWALRKWGRGKLPGGGGNRLRIQETLALGDRRFVSILMVEDERYLIATHPNGVNCLAKLDGEVLATPPDNFDEALAQHLNQPMPIKDMEALIRQNGGQG